MAARRLTCSGASVGVSISTQPRMPSRTVLASKGLEDVSMLWPVIVVSGYAIFGTDPEISRFRLRARARPGMMPCFSACQALRAQRSVRPFRQSFAGAVSARDAAGSSLEQERYRHLEYFGDLLDAACSDPVGAFLVLLNLLEGETQSFAKLLLAHAEHDPAHAHTTADIFVNRVGRFGRHLQHSLGFRSRRAAI